MCVLCPLFLGRKSLSLWERWQPEADGEGERYALSPANAGALPAGEPFFIYAMSIFLTSTDLIKDTDILSKATQRRF